MSKSTEALPQGINPIDKFKLGVLGAITALSLEAGAIAPQAEASPVQGIQGVQNITQVDAYAGNRSPIIYNSNSLGDFGEGTIRGDRQNENTTPAKIEFKDGTHFTFKGRGLVLMSGDRKGNVSGGLVEVKAIKDRHVLRTDLIWIKTDLGRICVGTTDGNPINPSEVPKILEFCNNNGLSNINLESGYTILKP